MSNPIPSTRAVSNSPRSHHHPDAMEVDPNSRYTTPPIPPPGATSISRPPSGLSGQGGYGADHASRAGSNGANDGQNNGRNHVVIKVGMVGDAQIGKTSLMVEVRGGKLGRGLHPDIRCQLHGEDHQHPEHRDHLQHLGLGRPARVCQYAAARMQRRRGRSSSCSI